MPKDFNWDSAYGLYVQGEELADEKMYPSAEIKLRAALQKDPDYVPALSKMAELLYHDMRYDEALQLAKKALSIDTYDGAANYYYGVINAQLGNTVDAKDGFDIAGLSMAYRSAAFNGLADIHLKEKNWDKALYFASRALDFNRFDIAALQIEAIAYRYQNNKQSAAKVLDTILSFDPLNHFAQFEKYLWQPTEESKLAFTSMIRDELPVETYLELAITYYNNGCYNESEKVLALAPQNALVYYWQAFLRSKTGKSYAEHLAKANGTSPAFVFPFRSEDEGVLLWAIKQNNNWQPKYYLALLYKDRNRITESKKLFEACENEPQFAPFYAARAAMGMGATDITDLKKAVSLEPNDWRYSKLLAEYYVDHQQVANALNIIRPFYRSHADNYIIGILYAKVLLLNKRYKECADLLTKIDILPFEGATIGRELYHEAELMQAIDNMGGKKYAVALAYIDNAKKWPENLGVGKPYAENLDERLEDWMAYQCYIQTRKTKEATALLNKIVAFNPKIENTVIDFLPANDLVTAWAITKLDGRAKAANWLNEQVRRFPDNNIVAWCKQVFENKIPANAAINDPEVRILQRLMQLK